MKLMFAVAFLAITTGCSTQFPSLPTESVLDMGHMLSENERVQLTERTKRLMDRTSMHIRLVTVDDIAPYKTASAYAEALYHSWELGDPSKHNGLLLLIARHIGSDSTDMKDYCRIMTGWGTRRILSDAFIVDEVKHRFMMPHLPNQPFLAFDASLNRITQEIERWNRLHPSDATLQPGDSYDPLFVFLVIGGIAVVVIVVAILVTSSPGRGGYYGGGGSGDSCGGSSCGGDSGCGGGGCGGGGCSG